MWLSKEQEVFPQRWWKVSRRQQLQLRYPVVEQVGVSQREGVRFDELGDRSRQVRWVGVSPLLDLEGDERRLHRVGRVVDLIRLQWAVDQVREEGELRLPVDERLVREADLGLLLLEVGPLPRGGPLRSEADEPHPAASLLLDPAAGVPRLPDRLLQRPP